MSDKHMTPSQEAAFIEMAANKGLTVREFAFQTTLIAVRDKCRENNYEGRPGWRICAELERLADEVLSVKWDSRVLDSDVNYLISRLRQHFPDPRDLGEHLMKEFNES
tara:strand:+ start:328 stop:651 length:324 start_codon:yes stop_codon:yes gene_type:complete